MKSVIPVTPQSYNGVMQLSDNFRKQCKHLHDFPAQAVLAPVDVRCPSMTPKG